MNKYEKLVEAIADLVDDDEVRWAEKRDQVKLTAKDNDRWDTSLEEFLSWFESEES